MQIQTFKDESLPDYVTSQPQVHCNQRGGTTCKSTKHVSEKQASLQKAKKQATLLTLTEMGLVIIVRWYCHHTCLVIAVGGAMLAKCTATIAKIRKYQKHKVSHTLICSIATNSYSPTRVYSHLFVRCQIDSACIFAYGSTSCVADHNYHVQFRKGWSHETDNRK